MLLGLMPTEAIAIYDVLVLCSPPAQPAFAFVYGVPVQQTKREYPYLEKRSSFFGHLHLLWSIDLEFSRGLSLAAAGSGSRRAPKRKKRTS